MARIRTIKPGFWTDEKLSQLSPLVRMTFLGLISAMADDAGRCKGEVRLVKASVWPLDDDVTTKTIGTHLAQLARAKRIVMYDVEGARYIQIVNWKRHQRIDKPRPSELPAPPDGEGIIPDDSGSVLGSIGDTSARDTEREVEGEWKGSGAEAATDDEPSAPPPAPLLSALALPKGVVDFLSMFYEPALNQKQRDRYRDIVAQLWEVLDPKHPGPKIRGGIRVKARNPQHLERECLAVMRDPPRDRDMAIVFVLKRLTNPEPGPTVSEKVKEATDRAIAEEEAYQRAARNAGAQWARDNPDGYAPIFAEVEAQFKGQPETFITKMAKESMLTQKCARAAGFPDFATWSKDRAA